MQLLLNQNRYLISARLLIFLKNFYKNKYKNAIVTNNVKIRQPFTALISKT